MQASFDFRDAKNCHWPHAHGGADERPRRDGVRTIQGSNRPTGLVVCSSAHYLMFSQFRVAGGLAASVRCGARFFSGNALRLPRATACRPACPRLEGKFLNTGTVKWFNAAKGFGFIQPEGGGADAFVHISAVERAGLDGLNEGDRVEYELVRGQNGKSSAENLKLAS